MKTEPYPKTPTIKCPDCDGKGNTGEYYSCCGDLLNTDVWICKSCGEHCDGTEPEECERCDGTGFIDLTKGEM